jgi:galactose mutarotase-like enzyme
MCKECTKYYQWQALCLETQTYPNSVFAGGEESIPAEESDFSKGRCFILRPGGGEYVHDMEYEFGEVLA